jgi:c-di-GMP phosphodiesterase
VLLARQPILDGRDRIHGHELLFRTTAGASAFGVDPERATSHVLVAASSDLDIAVLTGGRPAWVNVTRAFLLAFDPLPLDPRLFVIELLEDQLLDAALLGRLQRLRAEGHTIALDDLDPRTLPPGKDTDLLFGLATYAKLDVRALGGAFEPCCRALVARGLTVVAEKVETREERDRCAAAGASLFQGYFFERPRLIEGRPVPTGPLGRLQTAVALQTEDDRDEIAGTIVTDPGLSVRLLRFANSAAVGVRQSVTSVQEALILLGARPVRQWALLVLLSELGATRPALISAALLRARLCERIAREHGARDPDAYFAVGLLSVSDALLDEPLEQVLSTLPLTLAVRDALLHHGGAMGETLALAIALEHGERLDEAPVAALAGAVTWSEETLRELG